MVLKPVFYALTASGMWFPEFSKLIWKSFFFFYILWLGLYGLIVFLMEITYLINCMITKKNFEAYTEMLFLSMTGFLSYFK